MKNIFVFGSNLAGRHGAGSALEALKNHGAVMGQGWGLAGNSFAIPTKDRDMEVMEIGMIRHFVNRFLIFADAAPNLDFRIVAIGCGLAGYKPEQIAPMFKDAPANCVLPKEFLKVLNREPLPSFGEVSTSAVISRD